MTPSSSSMYMSTMAPLAPVQPAGPPAEHARATPLTKAIQPIVCVAYDGSPAAATALPVALAVAHQLGAVVELLKEEEGAPAAAILAAARDPRVVLIVLTTHGREVEEGRELGSVAEAIMAHGESPILLVRPEAAGKDENAGRPLRRLLVPLDGTPRTLAGLTPAIALARQLTASIDLLCVVPPRDGKAPEPGTLVCLRYVDQPQHAWPAWMSEAIARVAGACGDWPAGMPVQVLLGVGPIQDEILRVAAELQHDAIVLVRRSHLEPGRAAVLRAVVAAMPCPVLLVAAPGAEADNTAL